MSSATADRTAEFFVAGGTLHKDAPCYVSRPADEALYTAARRGDYSYVLTSRQMGKSSLMLRVTNRLREEGIAVVILDLTRIGAHNVTVEQWYAGLLAEVGRALDLRREVIAYWKQDALLPAAQRFFGALCEIVLPQVPGQIVLFVDEVDVTRSLSFSADEFFAGIRECYNRRTEDPRMNRLTFGLFGVASPSDLIQDTRVTPFNIGTRIELGDFAVQNAVVLADALGPNGFEQLKRVFYWTSGHPYLTLKLCRALAEDTTTSRAADVDRHASRLFFGPHARETDDNLLFVRRWLLEGGSDIAAVLDMYLRVWQGKRILDDETTPITEVLHLSGIVEPCQRVLTVRNRLYRRVFNDRWIYDHMPDAELRRQKAAFRRGALRTAWASGSVAIVLGALSIFAFSQKIRADQMAAHALQETQLARTKEREAVQLARQVTVMAQQLARIRTSETEAIQLRKRLEKLARATPSPTPTPTPIQVASAQQPDKNAIREEMPQTTLIEAAQPSPSATVTQNPLIPKMPLVRPDSPPMPPVPEAEIQEIKEDIAAVQKELKIIGQEETTEPHIENRPPLFVPPFLKQRAKRTDAIFRVTVASDGSHQEVLIRGTGHRPLDRLLRMYVSRFTWQPSMSHGEPVAGTVNYILELNEGPTTKNTSQATE